MAYQEFTLDDLRARLRARFDDVPFWTDIEANEAINEALCTWGMLTGRWKRRVTIQTSGTSGAGNPTYEYALPATLTYRARITFNGKPLSPASRTELDLGRPNWRRETTATGGAVPRVPTLWAPVSLSLIWIWPADAAGHNALAIDGVSTTPQLVLGGDFVDLAEADLSVLLGFCLHVLTLKKGGPWWAATQPFFRAFVEAAALENSLITTSQWYRRYMGLDRRDLKILKGVPASVAALVPQT